MSVSSVSQVLGTPSVFFFFFETASLFMTRHAPEPLFVFLLNVTWLFHDSDSIHSALTHSSQTWGWAPRGKIFYRGSPVIQSAIWATIIGSKGTVAPLQSSYSLTNNGENDKGSNNVTIIGSDPRLMRICCMVEKRSRQIIWRDGEGKTAQLTCCGKILLLSVLLGRGSV